VSDYTSKIDLEPDRAKYAAALIGLAFKWSRTIEGKDYWADVYRKLYKLAKDGGADMSDLKELPDGFSAKTVSMVDALTAAMEATGNKTT
jgi:hypothetical protein